MGVDSRWKPPSDLVAVLGDHLALNADRYGLAADALRLERLPSSTIEASRSFTVYDDDHAVHVKLWPAKRQGDWEQWLDVREVLESRYQAPRIIDVIDLPHISMSGLVFERIEGAPPVAGTSTHALARIHRCGAALGLEQGVRAVGRDGPRSIPINGAGGGLWLSLGAPVAVLGSGAGAGSAGQHAGEDNRGPGRCDSVGRLSSLVDGSGAVGAVRQAMAGLAIEPGRE